MEEVDVTIRPRERSRRRLKKAIFVSYSSNADFLERRFVVETVKQLKDNNLAEDLWFDRDENNIDSPCWFSLRMEAVERCRAAVLLLSDSYFTCPVSVYEAKVLVERLKADPHSVKIYPVLFTLSPQTEIPEIFHPLLASAVDLTKEHPRESLAERTSVVVGRLMPELEKHALVHAPPAPPTPPAAEFSGEYAKKKICQWAASDLQEWLFKLGIKEFYRQNMAESAVDGFLLMVLTDEDMIRHLEVDSRAARKKIMQQIAATLDREYKLEDNWHLRACAQKSRQDCMYLAYDPADARLAQHVKQDLGKKNFKVIHHDDPGRSKLEFLRLNGPKMATATHVLILLTEGATHSPFVFHEVLFADWLGKKLVTMVFKNIWGQLRPSMKAVLGDCAAVDFESQLYMESLSVLEDHLKERLTMPGVVLEQAYLNKMADGVRPLAQLGDHKGSSSFEKNSKIYISYQWDAVSKVKDIRCHLEAAGLNCWVDNTISMAGQQQHGHRSHSSISTASGNSIADSNSLEGQIHHQIKVAAVILCCVTPKYIQSETCLQDLALAEALHKTIIPVLLRFCPWPPDGAPPQVRRILARHAPVDLSNEKVLEQNVKTLVDRVKRYTAHRKV